MGKTLELETECDQSKNHQQYQFNPLLDRTQLLVATNHELTMKGSKLKRNLTKLDELILLSRVPILPF